MTIQRRNQNKLWPLIVGALLALVSSCAGTKEVGNGLNFNQLQKFETSYFNGCRYMILEEFDKAGSAFEDALKVNPESGATLYQLSQVSIHKGNLSLALYYGLEAIKKSDEYNYWYHLNVAQIYRQSGQHEYSAQAYQSMFMEEPFRKELYWNAAQEYMLAEDFRKAGAVADLLEENLGISEESARIKAQIHYMNGDISKVAGEFEKLCEAFPENASYKLLLVQAYIETGEYNKAKVLLETLSDESADNGEAWLLLAEAFSRKERYQEAYDCMLRAFPNPEVDVEHKLGVIKPYFLRIRESEIARKQAMGLVTIIQRAHPDDYQPLVLRSDVYHILGRYDSARIFILEALEKDAGDFETWYKLIELDARLKQPRLQISDINKALELFPNIANLYLIQSYAYYDLEEYDSTIYAADMGLDIAVQTVDRLELWSSKASALNKLGRAADADRAFETALEWDSRNTLVLNNYAYALAERGERLEYADSLIDEALRWDPENPYYLDTKGWIAFKNKEYDIAVQWIERALQYDSVSPEYHEHLAEIYHAKGDVSKARECMDIAMERGSDNKLLRDKVYSNRE